MTILGGKDFLLLMMKMNNFLPSVFVFKNIFGDRALLQQMKKIVKLCILKGDIHGCD